MALLPARAVMADGWIPRSSGTNPPTLTHPTALFLLRLQLRTPPKQVTQETWHWTCVARRSAQCPPLFPNNQQFFDEFGEFAEFNEQHPPTAAHSI